VKVLDELESKAKAATPGPWRSGRSDMRSFDAATGEQFKNIYGPNFEPKLHLGNKIAIEVAKAVGDASLEDAAFIAAANPQTVLALVDVVRAAQKMREGSTTQTRRDFDAALAKLEGGKL
jgi:hypothetical protein